MIFIFKSNDQNMSINSSIIQNILCQALAEQANNCSPKFDKPPDRTYIMKQFIFYI